jgi:hypothetical protein
MKAESQKQNTTGGQTGGVKLLPFNNILIMFFCQISFKKNFSPIYQSISAILVLFVSLLNPTPLPPKKKFLSGREVVFLFVSPPHHD